MSFAEVKKVNGSPALVIDGRAYPPMAMTTRFHKPEYIKRRAEGFLFDDQYGLAAARKGLYG